MKKVYVIFGGSGGMGFECAKLFGDGIVVISDINEEALVKAKAELEALDIQTYTHKCDITNEEDVREVANFASSLGELGAVINSAGISAGGTNLPLIMKIDYIGTAIILKEFLPYARPDMAVICLASMLGYRMPKNEEYDNLLRNWSAPDFMDKILVYFKDGGDAYAMAKHGVHLLCEEQAKAWGEKGARIISVSPGVIETAMAKESSDEVLDHLRQMTPLKRNGQAQEVANLIAFLCSDAATFITGCDIRIDGGLINEILKGSK